jgi:hypothetical protein
MLYFACCETSLLRITASHTAPESIPTFAHPTAAPAIPKLLELMDLRGAILNIDAMGTQREIADYR